jgi:ATP-dependent DNA helicase RecG
MLELKSRIQYVKGVGPKKAEALASVGITTVGDLLLYLPFRYEDWSRKKNIGDLQPGEEATITVEVLKTHLKRTRRRNFKVLEVLVGDETGKLRVIFFNQEFLKDLFEVGRRVSLFGKVERSKYGAMLEIKTPQYEIIEKEETAAVPPGGFVPVYERIGPLSPRMLRRILGFLVDAMPPNVPELLPDAMRRRHRFPTREEALTRVHRPGEGESLDLYNKFRAPAQLRLIFEEFFHFFVALGLRRRANDGLVKPRTFPVDDPIREIVRKVLPFRLTDAQRKVLKEIAADLSSTKPMRRIVQGDVGSGKTIVAVLASIIVIENKAQVAFMVPTELLAEQHFSNIQKVLAPAGYKVALLTSGLKRSDRDEILSAVTRGETHLVVGTHALIQEQVDFKDLGLVVIDEQHRFGVLQRRELRKKGFHPDLLVMTATPIPRSLSMTLYGDLDSAVLDELPPGRQPIQTEVKDLAAIGEVYREMEEHCRKGHQVYFVCPLIEESEKMDLNAAVERHDALRKGPFSHRRVALVHGRMNRQDRESVMAAFAGGQIDVLVATTVVEVGVDVPNATMMVIEHAERFGLSQLHQLRGRVGRGKAPSTAVLLFQSPLTPEAERRLQAMAETSDGFQIAERDLAIRGPGDYFGTRQSGVPMFRVADMVRDAKVRDVAKSEALNYLASSDSQTPEGKQLIRSVVRQWGTRFGLTAGG